MGIIDKLTGSSTEPSSTHSKYSDQSTTQAPAFGQDSTFGGQGSTNTNSSAYKQDIKEGADDGSSLLSDRNAGLTQSSSVNERGIDRQSERMGDMSLSTGNKSGSTGEYAQERYEVHTAAPVVQERVHDTYNNIDKEDRKEVHDKTEVVQTVQPLYDEKTESVQRDRVDHGVEVHEHGKAGLDSSTKAELAAKREQLSRENKSSHDESTTETDARPTVDVQERTNVIEEVVPVVERDVYRPHETEHTKKVIEIHHEAPSLAGTNTAAPMSLKDWEAQGHSIDTHSSNINDKSQTHRTRSGSSSSSSSSSSDEEGTSTGAARTTRKKGLAEKAREAVGVKDHKNESTDQGFAGGNSTTTY